MTIETTTNKIQHVATTGILTYAYDFLIQSVDQAQVLVNDTLISPSEYTVNDVGEAAGGDITFNAQPTIDAIITILREVAPTQLVDYQPYDPFPAETHEGALDKLTMICQQLQEELSRAVLAPITDDGSTDYTMPAYEAGKLIGWDDTEKKLVNSPADIQDAIDAADAAEASAAAALSSESNAAYRAQDAANCANAAYLWAQEAEDVEVAPDEYSAYHWAQKAQAYSGVLTYWGENGTDFIPLAPGYNLGSESYPVGDVHVGDFLYVGDIFSGIFNVSDVITITGKAGVQFKTDSPAVNAWAMDLNGNLIPSGGRDIGTDVSRVAEGYFTTLDVTNPVVMRASGKTVQFTAADEIAGTITVEIDGVPKTITVT